MNNAEEDTRKRGPFDRSVDHTTAMMLLVLAVSLVLSSCMGTETKEPARSDENGLERVNPIDSAISAVFERWHVRHAPQDMGDSIAPAIASILRSTSSFEISLDKTAQHAHVLTSDDGRIRTVTWLHPSSGSLHRYASIIWTRSGASIGVIVVNGLFNVDNSHGNEFDDVSLDLPEAIHHVRDSIYLVHAVGQVMGSMPYESLYPFVITPDTVHRADMRFYLIDQVVDGVIIDRFPEIKRGAHNEYSMPTLINVRSSGHVVSLPTIRNSVGGRIVAGVYGSLDRDELTVDETRPVRLVFSDTAFVEVPTDRISS